MIEKEPTVDTNTISGIPSDTKSPWVMDVIYNQDVFIQFIDSTAETGIYFQPIRFRTGIGGGTLPLIAEELSILPKAFKENHGQITDYKNSNETYDLFPSWLETTVRVGKKPDESKYIIKGIPDGDANPDDDNKFIDIEIAKNGNAIITMRDTRRNNQASIEFKTAENEGKYPIMAAVFTRIAERISRARRS